ncbi:hypothetical protein GQ457_02G029860 [Hibiscus cannabinus]
MPSFDVSHIRQSISPLQDPDFLVSLLRFKCYSSGSRSISTMQRSETTKIAWTLFGDEKSMELVAGQIKETCYLLSMVGRIVRP